MGKMKIRAFQEETARDVAEADMAEFERFIAESNDYRFDCECLGCTGEDIEGAKHERNSR